MSVSRRDLLALMLGAPLVGSCKKRERTVPGSIRGASMPVGHRLRDATVEHAGGAAVKVGVAIVGAGPSGLSAAWRMSRLGYQDYVVLDLEGQVGGTSAFGTDGVVPHPWGAHYVPLPTKDNRALVTLLSEMDVFESLEPEPRARETQLVREPEERVFVDGAWHQGLFPHAIATDDDAKQLERFQREVDRWVSWRDGKGRRAFTLPVRHCSDAAEVTELDRISAERWMSDRGLTSKVLRWYLEYACRDDYGLSLADTSAWALLFYFCSRVPKPREESEPFLTWPEGNGHIVRHLSSVAGARVKLGQLVTDVVPSESGVELSVLDTKTQKLTRYLAEHAILAIPKFIVPRILRPFRDKPPKHLEAFGYGVWMVANLHLSRRPRYAGFGPSWDNVIYDSPSLGYVVATHQRLSDYGPTVWTYYMPLTDSDPKKARETLAAGEHAGFCRAILADLEPAHSGLADALERIDVWRWGHAMVRPTPGLIWGGARAKAREPFGRVHFAHSDLSGVALFEEAQDHGVRAAEECLRALGRDFDAFSE
ncbi:MAG: FAD-dependent oxidoreductase [Polyangiaceae bacterium]|nr:FAD-dependent oxidoreductase [Polyangiaceae bacterium]